MLKFQLQNSCIIQNFTVLILFDTYLWHNCWSWRNLIKNKLTFSINYLMCSYFLPMMYKKDLIITLIVQYFNILPLFRFLSRWNIFLLTYLELFCTCYPVNFFIAKHFQFSQWHTNNFSLHNNLCEFTTNSKGYFVL